MPCVNGKDTYPDLQTALIVRDQLIKVYAVPMLAYKCQNGCQKWHLTTHWKSGRKVKIWNGLDTDKGVARFWEMVMGAGYKGPTITTIQPRKEYL